MCTVMSTIWGVVSGSGILRLLYSLLGVALAVLLIASCLSAKNLSVLDFTASGEKLSWSFAKLHADFKHSENVFPPFL